MLSDKESEVLFMELKPSKVLSKMEAMVIIKKIENVTFKQPLREMVKNSLRLKRKPFIMALQYRDHWSVVVL